MFSKPARTEDDLRPDQRFYDEILYIMGLKERRAGNGKLFQRYPTGRRNSGSLLENAISRLNEGKIEMLEPREQYGNSPEGRLFNVASELTVTWVVRVLFLKFVEGWLLSCHQGESSYVFLNQDKIKDYKDLDSLFFHVLSKRPHEREGAIKQAFWNVPYLNPSLFEPTDLERRTLFVSDLVSDTSLPLYEFSALKWGEGEQPAGRLGTLKYLLGFLDAYNFDLVGSNRIGGKKKAQISPSVIDKVFEGVVGSGDESFSAFGLITADRCREAIRASVIQKFNKVKKWECRDLDSLNNKILDRVEASDIINRLNVSDLIGSSSHLWVLALNELVVIKNQLKILQDTNGRWLRELDMQVVNGALMVRDGKGEPFEYHPDDSESQRIQEALFHEKKALVQNCLLREAVPPRSVVICRLRLWLELLKSAYYQQGSSSSENFSPVCYANAPGLMSEYASRELVSLPDIDITSGR